MTFRKILSFFIILLDDSKKRLYYERRSKQYDADPGIEKVRIVTISSQVRSFASMFLDKPHLASRFYGQLLEELKDTAFLEDHELLPYYTSSYALYKLEFYFRNKISTAGTARSVVALNPGTGQMLWMYQLDEGERGQFAPRRGAGRGVSYWSSPDGSDQRIIFVTPGYRMIALNAKTGHLVETFGKKGIVDLKQEDDQDLDLVRSVVGLNATPLVAGNVIVVGAAHAAMGSQTSYAQRDWIRAGL